MLVCFCYERPARGLQVKSPRLARRQPCSPPGNLHPRSSLFLREGDKDINHRFPLPKFKGSKMTYISLIWHRSIPWVMGVSARRQRPFAWERMQTLALPYATTCFPVMLYASENATPKKQFLLYSSKQRLKQWLDIHQ